MSYAIRNTISKKKEMRFKVLKRTAGLWTDRKDIKSSASWVAAKRKKQSFRSQKKLD